MALRGRTKKFVLTAIIIITLTFLVIDSPLDTFSQFYYYLNPRESIQCYHEKSKTLPDISEVDPEPGRSIFFHETSCNSYFRGKIVITARQACAVESAARQNPLFNVYLLYASPGIFKFEERTESNRFLQALLNYSNIKIYHLDYEKYTKNTPVEKLYQNHRIDRSGYAKSHASDILRYLTLWKYGGIYLDLDVIVTKSLEELKENYAGSESEQNVAAGILNFSPKGVGHQLARRCLEDLKHHFKGHDWGYNGPGVITRLLREICGEIVAKNMLDKDCGGFKVYPPKYFYPVAWWNWTMYFDENLTKDVLNISKDSYVIHVWNKHSIHTKIPIESKVPYVVFAQKYCPKVFQECEGFF